MLILREVINAILWLLNWRRTPRIRWTCLSCCSQKMWCWSKGWWSNARTCRIRPDRWKAASNGRGESLRNTSTRYDYLLQSRSCRDPRIRRSSRACTCVSKSRRILWSPKARVLIEQLLACFEKFCLKLLSIYIYISLTDRRREETEAARADANVRQDVLLDTEVADRLRRFHHQRHDRSVGWSVDSSNNFTFSIILKARDFVASFSAFVDMPEMVGYMRQNYDKWIEYNVRIILSSGVLPFTYRSV